MNKQELIDFLNDYIKDRIMNGDFDSGVSTGIIIAINKISCDLEPGISEIQEFCEKEGCDYCPLRSNCDYDELCPENWNIEEITKAINENKDI